MLRGLYTAASGMAATLVEADVIANNLANVNTPGFQPDRAIYSTFLDKLNSRINDPYSRNTSNGEFQDRPVVGKVGTGVLLEGVHTVFSQGKMEQSSNPLDLALTGSGFFAIETEGGTSFTRNGSFTLDNKGFLTTLDGRKVLGQRYVDDPLAPIQLPRSAELEIDEEGKIWVDKELVNQLAIRDFPKPYNITKIGRDLMNVAGEGKKAHDFVLQQGWLEKPDVSVVKEMVSLINAFRVYEANSKAVISNDQLMAKAVNDVGRYIG